MKRTASANASLVVSTTLTEELPDMGGSVAAGESPRLGVGAGEIGNGPNGGLYARRLAARRGGRYPGYVHWTTRCALHKGVVAGGTLLGAFGHTFAPGHAMGAVTKVVVDELPQVLRP